MPAPGGGAARRDGDVAWSWSRDRGPRMRGLDGSWPAPGRAAGRPGRDTRPARRPRRRGSGASPADPAGRGGCGRRAPRCAGRRRRGPGGPTTGGPARAGCRSTRRPRSRGRRRPAPGASRISSRVSARRASAASRWSRSAIRAGVSVLARRPPGRSRTSRSTERPASSEPAMPRPSSRVAGVMTTSHSSRTPRATASTGSKLRDRSSQATTEPSAWASAATRRASVVRPLEPSPRIATLAEVGRPPGPRIASSAAKPVWMTRWPGSGAIPGRAGSRGRPPPGSGARASAPSARERPPRSCRTPASLEARERGVHISTGGRHRTPILEHLFYSAKALRGIAGPGEILYAQISDARTLR